MRCAPALTLVVAFAVLGKQGSLPGPDEVDSVVGTQTGLYLLVLVCDVAARHGRGAARQLGADDHARPRAPSQLEKANGRLWSIEAIANTFVGPPLGSLLLIGAFALPFFVDAGSFFVAAALVALIPGAFRAERDRGRHRLSRSRRAQRGCALADASPTAAPDGDHPRPDERRLGWRPGDVRAVLPGGARHRAAPVQRAQVRRCDRSAWSAATSPRACRKRFGQRHLSGDGARCPAVGSAA